MNYRELSEGTLTNLFFKTAAKSNKDKNQLSNRIQQTGAGLLGAGTAEYLLQSGNLALADKLKMRPKIGELSSMNKNDYDPVSQVNNGGTPKRTKRELQQRSFDTVAKRLGFTKDTEGVYSHPNRKHGLRFRGPSSAGARFIHYEDVAKKFPGQGPVYDEIYALPGELYKNKGVLAHELGHAKQSLPWIKAAVHGQTVAKASLAGIGLANMLNPEFDTTPLAAMGTVGAATTLANELHASYLGSKAFRSFKGKMQAFRGVPTYAVGAGVPYAAHKASQWAKDKVKEYNK